ncbi:helix-turn-helix domain-containing protein [Shewanella algae]|uniref:helix-turn-helix domain-containing protein n=1 Tax=Shewanella algae TaxID=38313 RepID=UPI0031F5DA4C
MNSVRDMHQAEIIAKVRMRGSSMRQLSINAGLAPDSLRNVFYRTWPKGQEIVADFIEIEAPKIWPSRYQERSEVA